MKNIIQIFILIFILGAINSTAESNTSIRYVLFEKNVKNIEIVPQGSQFSLRIALTESATEAFFNFTKDNIGKTIHIEFEGVLISGGDIEAPIQSGHILSIPATVEGAESLRRRILSGRSNAP